MSASPPESTPKRIDSHRLALLKEFLKTFCEDTAFLAERRKILRLRAGLKETDRKLVPKFRFVVYEGRSVGEREVESALNFEVALQYMASFAHSLPRRKELEAALAWASSHYKLNPWRRFEQHMDWAITETGALMSIGSYCMDRFQRNVNARPGHGRMEDIKAVIRIKLEEHDLLTPEGKRVASRGRNAKSKDRLAVVPHPDAAETQPMEEHGTNEHLSPVRPMQPLVDAAGVLRRGRAASNLSGGTAPSSSDSKLEDDLDEEEELQINDDGCVVPTNEFQDNETLQIMSDDECVMSPQKRAPLPPDAADNIYARKYGDIGVNKPEGVVADELPHTQQDSEQPDPQPQDSQTPKDGSHEVPGFGMLGGLEAEIAEELNKVATSDQVEVIQDSQDDLLEAKVAEETQDAIKSDDEPGNDNQNSSKGAFKDHKPLIALPEMPKELQDHALKPEPEYEEESKVTAEFLKAQGALRQMKKEQEQEVEDPDKLFAEDGDDELPVKKGRGKGKGRGRGKGRGPKANAKQKASEKHGPEGGGSSEGASKAECEAKEDGPQEQQQSEEKATVTPQKKRPRANPKTKAERKAVVERSLSLTPDKKKPKTGMVDEQQVASGSSDDAKTGDATTTPAGDAPTTEPSASTPAAPPSGTEMPKPKRQKKEVDPEKKEKTAEKLLKARIQNFQIMKDTLADDVMMKIPADFAVERQRSFMVPVPEDLPPKLQQYAARIQVLLVHASASTASFYVMNVNDRLLKEICEFAKVELQANRQSGVSIAWMKNGGVAAAWKLAKMVASWMPTGPDSIASS